MWEGGIGTGREDRGEYLREWDVMPRTKRVRAMTGKRKRAKKARRAPSTKYIRNAVLRLSESKCRQIHNNEFSLSSLNQGNWFDPMNIAVGTGSQERVGNTITATGLHLKGYLHNNATSDIQYVRMLIYKGKNNDNFDNTSSFFEDGDGKPIPTTDLAGSRVIYHPIAKNKVTVLKDKVFKVGTGNGTADRTRFFNMWIPLKNQKIRFEGDSSNQPSKYPRYHICFFTAESDEDIVGAQTVEISFVSRFYYKDF